MRIVGFGSGGVDRKRKLQDISDLMGQLPPGDDQRLMYVDKRRGDIIADLEAGNIEPYKEKLGSNPKAWLRFLSLKNYERSFGGKGSNAVFAAAKMGVETHFFGAFGGYTDIDSNEHIEHLERVGVKVDVQRIEGETLSQAYVYADAQARQVSMIYRGANKHALQQRIPDALLDRDTIVMIQTSVPVVQSMALARRAKARGATVVFNCTNPAQVERTHFQHIDELVVNQDEAAALAKKFGIVRETAGELAVALADQLDVVCVITRGKHNVVSAEKRNGMIVVDDIVTPRIVPRDVTGAGDALLGSYVAFRAKGHGVHSALEYGVLAGAFTAKSPDTTSARLSPRILERAKGILAAFVG
ncbi:MAG: PfkB family carbohydrate kinase [Alphaproteobacteria bacterium]|nr:PfkB family carbohydrate kinase [Alphaproteobacteria bacterium]